MSNNADAPTGRWRLGANTTDTPVVIDDDGHQLGGREYGPLDTTQDAVQDAVDRGAIVWPDNPARTARTDAGHALREVERLNKTDQPEQPTTSPKEA